MANRFQAKGGEIICVMRSSALTEHAAGIVGHRMSALVENRYAYRCRTDGDAFVKMLGVEPVC